MEASSSDDEDSDVEKNFALLTERGGRGAEEGERDHVGEDVDDFSDDDEEGSDGGNEEEEDEEGSDAGEEESDADEEEEEAEAGGDSDASEEDDDNADDEGPENAGCSGEIQTREDIKNGEFVVS